MRQAGMRAMSKGPRMDAHSRESKKAPGGSGVIGVHSRALAAKAAKEKRRDFSR